MNDMMKELATLGVATVYEAQGRQGLLEIELHQITPHSRGAGPARTALCAQNDNLTVHAVMDSIQPGEILVLAMPKSEPVALVGELLATQALKRGVVGMLIDAAVRDVETLSNLGLPIWSRFIRVRGAERKVLGEINVTLELGSSKVHPGDIIVLDADGAVVIQKERLEEVLQASRARMQREAELRSTFEAGQLSIDVYGLRAGLEAELVKHRK